eukprot:TRINITY_DN199_c0_g2_i2.p1 TRINITY_DN199_c0_g2~~TRINITY_DN199_c0_g2_i2.p1  ORF type:complete len:110 (+),score=16.61 TRINITY_DN199_c0_g2_i2:145-474(+)
MSFFVGCLIEILQVIWIVQVIESSFFEAILIDLEEGFSIFGFDLEEIGCDSLIFGEILILIEKIVVSWEIEIFCLGLFEENILVDFFVFCNPEQNDLSRHIRNIFGLWA